MGRRAAARAGAPWSGAREPAEVEEDRGIRTRQPIVEGAEPHRVDHPRVARDQLRVRVLPAGPVEVEWITGSPSAVPSAFASVVLPAPPRPRTAMRARYDATATASSRGTRRETICDTPSLPIVTP